jgi:RNA polymerase sigma-70 factor (ECF subfamily)
LYPNKYPESKPIDSALLSALCAGDQQAFEAVYLRYVSSIRHFLTFLTRSNDIGQEIAQDVFVTLWERRKNIDPQKNISGYLYTIAKNCALKHFNAQKGVSTAELSLVDRLQNAASADAELTAWETEQLVEVVVARMPAQRRKIYELSRKEGLSNGEIADRLNISKNTVENHITTALKNLRKVLG